MGANLKEDKMKYVKSLGLLVIAAAILMAFAGSASAIITSEGKAYNGEIEAKSFNSESGGEYDWHCLNIVVKGTSKNNETTYPLSSVAFNECGVDTVTVLKNGSWRFASNGTLFWEALEFTVQLHRKVFGFPITTHCIYASAASPGTDIGDLTEGTATIDLNGAELPGIATDAACGEAAEMTGEVSITKPGALTID